MSFYINHYSRLRPALFDMMKRGVGWDREGANEKAVGLETRRESILAEIQKRGLGGLLSTERHRSRLYAGLLQEQRELRSEPAASRDKARLQELARDSKTIRAAGLQTETIVKGLSDDKIKTYFYKQEGVQTIRQRRKGKGASTPTVNDIALLTIKAREEKYRELIDLILEYRRCQKLVSTYLDPKKVDEDGRIRFTYKPHGTQSGRLSSSGGTLGGGFNIQNPDGELKYLIIPDRDSS